MCGIVGFRRSGGFAGPAAMEIVNCMSAELAHRGPDDSGTWLDADAGIALGHRRLSVLDLSSAGHQPMLSASGRYVIVFNGEIYNHLEIREELQQLESPPEFRGHSDTETLLAAFDRWDTESVLKKTVGMFAFALWDRQERVLTLARDRIGEKPLYYGWQGDAFLFGSELKGMHKYPEFRGSIDRDAVALYFLRGYIEAPHSIYQNISKLLPGTYIQLTERDSPGSFPTPQPYWSLRDVIESGLANPFIGSDEEAADALEIELTRAISFQSVADVPLGAFLSGGIDSSTIVALMQTQSSRPVKTFTIGFHEGAYDEATHAQSVAEHLGTDHTELYVTSRDAIDVIPKLPELYDEPFGDSSAIPTFLVSQLAKQHVTVSLSGDGGDELFGGYTRYQRTKDIWDALHRIPYFARYALSHGVRKVAMLVGGSPITQRMYRLAQYLSVRSADGCYRVQISQSINPDYVVLGATGGPRCSDRMRDSIRSRRGLFDTMMYMDTLAYLPDDILTKVDRASMGVSLESRVPMLDHRVLEFAWRLPLHMKVRERQGKWLLKLLLRRYIPSSFLDRPKMGFGVPVGQWIRGPLRDWAEDLLSEARLQQDGLLNPSLVRRYWSQHLTGASVGSDSLWQLLMFQAWCSEDVRQ